MVNHLNTPSISWDENLNSQEVINIANLITDTLTAALPSATEGQSQLFFTIPTPTPYSAAEQQLLATKDIQEISNSHFRIIDLPNNGKCYVLNGRGEFCRFIPHAFQLGPPELTFLAANCAFGLMSNETMISDFVVSNLKKESHLLSECTGMHFDSGDLVEVF